MNLLRAEPMADKESTSSAPDLVSGIYTGWVRHRRYGPRAHAFRYRLFLMYLDLSEIDEVFAHRWFWSGNRRNLAEFRRSDYLGDPAIPLDQAVRDCVEAHEGVRPRGPIRLLAHLRYFGHCFNPVAFYYCYDEDGHTLQTVVTEITNTPWKQRHAYVLPVDRTARHGTTHAWQFDKRFHVSPFMAMERAYAWRLSAPDQALRVHMDVLKETEDGDSSREFDATMVLQRKPADAGNLARVLLLYPFMTLRVVIAIHWQALRLWMRGNPVHDHPHNRPARP